MSALRPRIIASAALAFAVLLAVAAVAQSGSTQRTAKRHAPLRAVFYLTAPVRTSGLAVRPAGRYARDDAGAVKRHLVALAWARADAAIMPWALPGSPADRKLAAVLAAIASTHAHVRGVALLNRSQGSEARQIGVLAGGPATSPGYLRIGSRPAVFVAPSNRALRSCTIALRWRAADARSGWLRRPSPATDAATPRPRPGFAMSRTHAARKRPART